MTQTAEPVVGAPSAEPLPTAGHRSRWRRWHTWVGGLVTLLAIALVAGGIWLVHYQPVGEGGGGFAVQTANQDEVHRIDNAYGTDYRIVAPKPGDQFDVEFPLMNDGPLSVTIDNIAQPFNPDGIVTGPSQPYSTSGGTVAFATPPSMDEFNVGTPFTLGAGQTVEVRLRFSILQCATIAGPPGQTQDTTAFSVTYRTLGYSHTARIDVGFALSVESMPRCP